LSVSCGEPAAEAADFAVRFVELLLDLLEPLRERAQAALQAFDVARRGQIEGAHRRVLGLDHLLPCAEGGGDRVVDRGALDQCLRQLADRLLGTGAEPVLVSRDRLLL